MRRAPSVLALSGLGIAVGVFSLDVARAEPSFSFAGTSVVGGAALLVAGWALIASGLAFLVRRPKSRFGPLLAAAGFFWFLLEWNNPGIGSSIAFTIGLALYLACPPVVAHAVLAYPGGRLASRIERVVLGTAYVAFLLVAGVVPALLSDPRSEGCSQCPSNLLSTADRPELATDLTRLGVYLGLASALALALLALVKLVRASSAARRAGWPVLAAGAVYLGLVAAVFAASLDRGYLATGTLERRLWLGQAGAAIAITFGVSWGWVRGRRARSEVARLVVDLAHSPPAGGLRDVLAASVGDPELVLAYPVGHGDRLVDARGQSVELPRHQEQTPLVRDARPVAILSHRPGLLDDEELVEEAAAAARLALENERLQADVRTRLEDLRASRARIVEAGDVERKRLERDLHDGAQQRLVGLALSLRLLRSQLGPDASPNARKRLDEADAELRSATVELRELAHGIFPAVLAGEGLAAAVEALAEDARVPIRIRGLPEGRWPAAVEAAAYTVVAGVASAATDRVSVRGVRSDGILLVEVEAGDLDEGLDLVELEDRVGALGGRLTVEHRGHGGVTIHAELPAGPAEDG